MTSEEFDEILERTNAVICNREWYERAIKALEVVEEFEKAQIITGGRLNGRTYAYKCGLEDGKRKALEQEPKIGHWIDSGIYGEIDGQITKAYTCSKCGAISIFRVSDGYIINADNCPNCGAKMLPTDSEKE